MARVVNTTGQPVTVDGEGRQVEGLTEADVDLDTPEAAVLVRAGVLAEVDDTAPPSSKPRRGSTPNNTGNSGGGFGGDF